ncbi:MAG: deoxyribose-phosphate aldolase [Clostridia bacterium]|nr:deoxyribose-phosphate aldolase [Clostridia bacterium]
MPKPSEIARMLDHSMLQPWLTEADIRKGCAVAIKYHTAAVCARPCDMKLVSALLKGTDIAPCTVIGFPHGTHLTAVKVYEAEQALLDGCAELDMVINIGRLKAGDDAYVENDIHAVAEAAHRGGAILKVIIETCCLTDEEKVRACQLAEKAGADFVKTSTGYGAHGATPEDVALMRSAVSEKVKVKAAGGMRNLDAILAVRAAGADRCGVSATEAIMKEAEERLAE